MLTVKLLFVIPAPPPPVRPNPVIGPSICMPKNLCKEWKQWRQVWDALHEEVTELRNKTSRLRVATFITCIGKEALEVHNGLPFQSDEEKADINKVLELWANHCIGKTNIIYERYKIQQPLAGTDGVNRHLHHLRSERSPKLASLEP